MDNLKKWIAILTIVILIIITALIILRLKGKNDNIGSDFENTQFENIDTYEAENKIEKVKNKNKYYSVQRIIDSYIQYIKEVKGIINFQKYDDDEIKEEGISKLYDILDSNYISEQNIKKNQLQNIIKEYNEYDVEIEDMYIYEKTSSINVYFVNFSIDNEEMKILIKTDSKNMTFSVFLEDFIQKNNYSENMDVKNIDITDNEIQKNENNQFKYTNISNEYMAKQYINSIKNNMLNNVKYTYDNLFENEYKEKRFGSLNNFVSYIEMEKDNIENIEIVQYLVNNYNDYSEYVCVDKMGNYYIIKENAIMDYTFQLDTYTITQDKFLNTYSTATDEKKVQMNIDKFIQMINRHDYRTSYNCIADSFKNNYFKTQEEFQNYIENNFYSYNKFEFKSCEKKAADIYVCKVQLTDYMDENSEIKEINVIMQLGDNLDFKMSFGM